MDKKAFILYQDYRKHLDLIADPIEFRVLIEAIFDFADGKEVDASALPPLSAMAFSFISSNISRDLAKYDKIKNARIEAGSKGGLAKVANASKAKQKVANCSKRSVIGIGIVNDTDNVNGTDININTVREKKEYITDDDFKNLWGFVPKRDGTNNKLKAKRCIIARLKEGHTLLELESGLNAYRGYCTRSGVIETEMVMTMSRFFGRDKYFLKENKWEEKGYERTDSARKYSPADMQTHLENKARDLKTQGNGNA
jgi:hypothetical protein